MIHELFNFERCQLPIQLEASDLRQLAVERPRLHCKINFSNVSVFLSRIQIMHRLMLKDIKNE